jgi:hypothetical protein
MQPAASLRHVRPPQRLVFPEHAKWPESKRHLTLRTALYQLLLGAFAPANSAGSEQFLYWNARDPSRCAAPDAFVKLGVPDESFRSWKTWERGTPELCVEIVSDSDERGDTWEEKLRRYHELGVRELVAFDGEAPPGSRLRVWDRLEDDLVERAITDDRTPCASLGLWWIVAPLGGEAIALRLARDSAGKELLPTAEEARAEAAEARSRADEERAHMEKRLAEALAENERLRRGE